MTHTAYSDSEWKSLKCTNVTLETFSKAHELGDLQRFVETCPNNWESISFGGPGGIVDRISSLDAGYVIHGIRVKVSL